LNVTSEGVRDFLLPSVGQGDFWDRRGRSG